MPILTDDSGIPLVVLGEGDVAVCCTATKSDKPSDGIVFIQEDEKHPIGEIRPELIGESTADQKEAVRIQFLNLGGLDVLIHRLIVLRAEMAWGNEKTPAPSKL